MTSLDEAHRIRRAGPAGGKEAPHASIINEVIKAMEIKKNEETRILARSLARELTAEEIDLVSGAGCTRSTCSASDNSSCDLDQCGDTALQ
ncbi:MAG: hypothetical protein JNN30_20050 [Rhodanobacteraceae bacterium]|nr:hypothetical protein [Rhodanobacteraceae bacterium]